MKPRFAIILLAILAFVAKLYCAATTAGSSDVFTFWSFAHHIHEHGLIAMYRETPAFNHTPLVGWFAELARSVAIRQDPRLFSFYLRLPGIFADLIAVFALLWLREKTGRPPWWALALFAVSPVSFMVSGFHGNVDSLMVLGLLLAALACVGGRPGLSGVFFGLSCNFKVTPLLLFPALFCFWFQQKRAVRFSLSAFATTVIGWSVPLFTIPFIFLRNVLGYSSVWGNWGVTYLLRVTNLPAFHDAFFSNRTPAEAAVTTALKLSTIAGVLFWAWRRRQSQPLGVFKTLAISYATFFALAPGFGVQYLLWPAPFFLVAAESWYLALTIASSIGLFLFYTAECGNRIPWDAAVDVGQDMAKWDPWGGLSWLVFTGYFVLSVRREWLALFRRTEGGVRIAEAPEGASDASGA